MNKPRKLDFRVLSNHTCKECSKYLKQNLIDRNPDAQYCFKHQMKLVRHNPRYQRF
jgi:hypothetical protein